VEHDLQIPLQETNELRNKFDLDTPMNHQENLGGLNSDQRNTIDDGSANKSQDSSKGGENFANSILDTKGTYTPIKSLNTFLFDWKIKARVTKKHIKKAWRNQKGGGNLLNIELIDIAGTQI